MKRILLVEDYVGLAERLERDIRKASQDAGNEYQVIWVDCAEWALSFLGFNPDLSGGERGEWNVRGNFNGAADALVLDNELSDTTLRRLKHEGEIIEFDNTYVKLFGEQLYHILRGQGIKIPVVFHSSSCYLEEVVADDPLASFKRKEPERIDDEPGRRGRELYEALEAHFSK